MSYAPKPPRLIRRNRGCVYRIVNIHNGRQYIGATNNPLSLRLAGHRSSLVSGRHKNKHLQRDWDLYGESAFRAEVLERTIHVPAWVREREWIHRAAPDTLYNILRGVTGWQKTQPDREVA